MTDDSARAFTFRKTAGSWKRGDFEEVATYAITGLSLKKVGEIWKVDSQDAGNLAVFKGLLEDCPQFASRVMNTMAPAFIRERFPDGFRGTIRQAVETARDGNGEE